MTNYLQQKTLHLPQIRTRVARNLGLCLVIPAYDEPYLLRTLMSLKRCDLPTCAVEIIVVINNGQHVSEGILEKNRAIYLQALEWAKNNLQPLLKFHILFHDDLPKLFANVDLARKIGMDEAAFRLQKAKKKRGIIATIDADCKVEKNFFTALETHFRRRKVPRVCQVKFAFPLEGIDFDDKVYAAIIQYELHLRYVKLVKDFLEIENEIESLSTGFAMDNETYQKKGGWNSIIGKSDLHKGAYFLKTTTIYPSPRPSKRSKKGTGQAVSKMQKGKPIFKTFHPQSFQDVKCFFEENGKQEKVIIADLKNCPISILNYFKEVEFVDCKLDQENLKDFFDKHHLMTYLDFVHKSFYKKIEVVEAVKMFIEEDLTPKEILLELRRRDGK